MNSQRFQNSKTLTLEIRRFEALIREAQDNNAPSQDWEELEEELFTLYDLDATRKNENENHQIRREWDTDFSERWLRHADLPPPDSQGQARAGREARRLNAWQRQQEERREQARAQEREYQQALLRSRLLGAPAPRPRQPAYIGRPLGWRTIDRLNQRRERAIAIQDREELDEAERRLFAMQEHFQEQQRIIDQAAEAERLSEAELRAELPEEERGALEAANPVGPPTSGRQRTQRIPRISPAAAAAAGLDLDVGAAFRVTEQLHEATSRRRDPQAERQRNLPPIIGGDTPLPRLHRVPPIGQLLDDFLRTQQTGIRNHANQATNPAPTSSHGVTAESANPPPITRTAPGNRLRLPRRTLKEEFNADFDDELNYQSFMREARQWASEQRDRAQAAGDHVGANRFEQVLRGQERAMNARNSLNEIERRNQRRSNELAVLRARRDYELLAANHEPYVPPEMEESDSNLNGRLRQAEVFIDRELNNHSLIAYERRDGKSDGSDADSKGSLAQCFQEWSFGGDSAAASERLRCDGVQNFLANSSAYHSSCVNRLVDLFPWEIPQGSSGDPLPSSR